LPDVEFDIDCSSGTYIRSVARDVGSTLGVGGHLTALRRTRIGQYTVDAALAPEQLGDAQAVRRALVPPAAAVSHLPQIVVDRGQELILRHGGSIAASTPGADADQLAIVGPTGALVGIGERRGDRVQPRKVLA
jgi:tRNA pseudouridine55 synthase